MTTTPSETRKERPVEARPDEEAESFGTWLRRERELREITLREIADTSKISLRYLQALEQDRFDLLPAPVFAKGFLRQYARYVGLDPEETVNFYLAANRSPQDEELEPTPSQPKTVATWSYALVVLLAAILLMVVTWALLRLNRDAARGEAAPSSSEPQAVEPVADSSRAAAERTSTESDRSDRSDSSNGGASGVPATPPDLAVTLDFRGDCWIRATVDGTAREDRVYTQGESLQLTAQSEIELELGNVYEVDIELNGRPLAVDDGSQNPVRRLRIDTETAAALLQGEENEPGDPT